MAEMSYLWNNPSVGDSPAGGYDNSTLCRVIFRMLFNGTGNQGVLQGWLDELEVTSISPSPSISPSASVSPSPSASISPSASESPSPSASVSPSASESPSVSPSVSPSASLSISPSASVSPSSSASPSVSPSVSPSSSVSPSPSASISPSSSESPSVSPSVSPSASISPSPSPPYSGLDITVKTGGAFCYGVWFENDAQETLIMPNNATTYVVVRANWVTQQSRLAAVAAMVKDPGNTFYDIPLASVTTAGGDVTNITDLRDFCEFSIDMNPGTVTTESIEDGAVTTAKLANQTRWISRGYGELKPDATNPPTLTYYGKHY